MKGINKLVLEVKPDDEYFEKALLFLKPAANQKPQHEISEGADLLLCRIKDKQHKKKKYSFITAFLLWASGASFMWILMLLLEHVF